MFRIGVAGEQVSVPEEMIRGDGSPMVVSVEARLNGNDYPLIGPPGADFIAYSRVDALTLSGIAKKDGVVCLTERLTASADGGTLALQYAVVAGGNTAGHGTAIFRRMA